MDGMSLLIVIALTWWLTGRYYKKKFGVKTVYVVEQPEQPEENLATQAYRRHKARRKVEFEDD